MLWLWHRPVATAPIRQVAWEPPCAAGVALEKTEKKKKSLLSCHDFNKVTIELNIVTVISNILFSYYPKNKYVLLDEGRNSLQL